jgi:hypothetical protein
MAAHWYEIWLLFGMMASLRASLTLQFATDLNTSFAQKKPAI